MSVQVEVKVEIFDDPEYCGKEDCCNYLANVMFLETTACSLFCVNLKETESGNLKKCDQCKEAYQKTKT